MRLLRCWKNLMWLCNWYLIFSNQINCRWGFNDQWSFMCINHNDKLFLILLIRAGGRHEIWARHKVRKAVVNTYLRMFTTHHNCCLSNISYFFFKIFLWSGLLRIVRWASNPTALRSRLDRMVMISSPSALMATVCLFQWGKKSSCWSDRLLPWNTSVCRLQ